MDEDKRQIVHLALGICAIAGVIAFGAQAVANVAAAVLVCGLALVHAKLARVHLGFFENFLERLERPGSVPGYGALTYFAGMLAILTLLPSQQEILASLCILGIGDSASTLIGIRSKRKLPYSRRKTVRGTLGFFLSSAPFALYFAGLPGALVAAIAALAESLEARVDDNLIIAIVCVVAFRLIEAA